MEKTKILAAAAAALMLQGCGSSESSRIARRTSGFDLDILPAYFTKGHRPGMGYCNAEGEVIMEFTDARQTGLFHDGLAFVSANGTKGFINKEGELIIDLVGYRSRSQMNWYFSEGLCLLNSEKSPQHFAAFDKNGEVKFELPGEALSQMRDGLAFFTSPRSSAIGVVNAEGEVVFEPSDDGAISYMTVLDVYTPASCAHPSCFPIYDKSGDLLYFLDVKENKRYLEGLAPEDMIYGSGDVSIDSNDRIVARTSGGYGLLKLDGSWAVEPQYDELINDGEWYVVNQDGLLGWIDKDGNVMIEPEFNYRGPSAESRFGGSDWCLIDSHTFIDRKGEIVLQTSAEAVTNFIGDRCLVVAGSGRNRAGYSWMNREGEIDDTVLPLSESAVFRLAQISRGYAPQYLQ